MTSGRSASLPLENADLQPSVGVVYSTKVNDHVSWVDDHYERPERITRTWQLINDSGCHHKLKIIPIRLAHKNQVMLVHSEDHWDQIQDLQKMTREDVQHSKEHYERLSLYVNPETTRAALLSCGGVIAACMAVADQMSSIKKAIAIVRPPGHHAEPTQAMGFCFFNNVAVAARVVQQETDVQRILIIDWDVHHGNGTQKAFEADPTVLYISLHRFDGGSFYPGGPYGGLQSSGEGPGRGFSVNIPWPEEGMGDAEYLHAFQTIVMPIAMQFAPQLVIISAGFDAAEGDPLGNCNISPAGYAHMTHMLSGLAGGRLVVALEGGYNVESVAKSALAVTKVVIGEAPPELPPMVANEIATETVWFVAQWQRSFWSSINLPAAEPREDYGAQTVSIPELLKIFRQNFLADTFGMMQIPLLDGEMKERFGAQVMCTGDILKSKTLIFFMHEFGNIQTELESSANCHLDLERSYLIDVSKEIISWVTTEGFGLLDVNLFPKPFLSNLNMKQSKLTSLLTKEVLVYLWDNFVQLSGATNIILIGHGPGCHPMISLLKQRWQNAAPKLKGIVQVIGQTDLPSLSSDEPDELRSWYAKNSLVVVPSDHPYILNGKIKKRHGKVLPIHETRAVKLIMDALPEIKTFIMSKLRMDESEPSRRTLEP